MNLPDPHNHYWEITKHKFWVFCYMTSFAIRLIWKAIIHDFSKFSSMETEGFCKVTRELKNSTYGTDEYFKNLKRIQPAIDHHYAHNSHHPEYYRNGIYDMNLFDIVEMVADWLAAVKRHTDGNINRSIRVNSERFEMEEQLVEIIKNSIK